MWMDVKYQPGTIKVVAFDNNGEPVKEKEIKTAGKPYQIVLKPENTSIKADGKDLMYVEVSVVDKDGIPCPTATNQLKFNVKGKGTYKVACNGDATSLDLFHVPTMKLFSGKLVVTVEATNNAGEIQLEVTGKGLKTGKAIINSIK